MNKVVIFKIGNQVEIRDIFITKTENENLKPNMPKNFIR